MPSCMLLVLFDLIVPPVLSRRDKMLFLHRIDQAVDLVGIYERHGASRRLCQRFSVRYRRLPPCCSRNRQLVDFGGNRRQYRSLSSHIPLPKNCQGISMVACDVSLCGVA